MIRVIREKSKTDIGRTRLFLRKAINDGALVDYLNALRYNIPLSEKYYEDYSVLRNEELGSIMILLLENIFRLRFNLSTQLVELDNDNYWQIFKAQ